MDIRRRSAWSIMMAAVMSLLLVTACGGGGTASQEASGEFNAESYFQGKTIRMVITQSVGGGTDVAMRFVAQHLGKFIPGNPTIDATNLQDTAGMNRAYGAPPDQLVIGATSNAQGIYTSAQMPDADHDPQDLQVLGSFAPSPLILLFSGQLGYKDFAAAMNAPDKKLLRFAGAVGGADEIQDDQMMTGWLCDTLDLNCEMIQVADDGSAALNLMLERGEITADSATLTSRVRTLGDGLQSGKYVLAAVYDSGDGAEGYKLPDGVTMPPDLVDVVPANLREDYSALLPISGSGGLGNTLWTGPDMPEDVVNALRQGLADMAADPEVLADFEELQQAQVEFIPGAEAQDILRDAATVYADNLDSYATMQQKYWDKYWKP